MNESSVFKCFYLYFKSKKPTIEETRLFFRQLDRLLKKGWLPNHINNRIVMADYKGLDPDKISSLLDIPSLNQVPPHRREGNLMTDDFYYHNELHRYSKPALLNIDIEAGELEFKENPFYFQMKEIYTADDLLHYFEGVIKIDDLIKERSKNDLCYYVENYDLDSVLFTIDAIRSAELLTPVSSVNIIPYYINEGRKRLEKEKNIRKKEIVPMYLSYFKGGESVG